MARELSKIIDNWVPRESKVIDFGCGDGSLLQKLMQTKNVLGYGVEINDSKIEECIAKGVPVIKQDIDKGINEYAKNLEKTNKEFNVKKNRLEDKAKKAYDEERATLSGLYVSNAIMPVIYKFFSSNDNRVNSKIIQAFVAYASSRTPKSGKFVIAK